MQLVVPSAVPAAVMMAASTWMMNFQMSFLPPNRRRLKAKSTRGLTEKVRQ